MPRSHYVTKLTILENTLKKDAFFYLNLTLRGCLSLVNILKEGLKALKKMDTKTCLSLRHESSAALL